ncbi:hypothetical protein [Paludisphaera borealis]|uniref:Uncharacterized protein n=1 Tax=Paludisphaera borealis TaxID=1387353 RepID=A0A1U7CW41_9BACT|nr:hypothetical protein [Paludisphaera borealis]APW63170.1 hypothetical protein BSF38_04733 [Paludisphaera borealis]
MGNTLGCLALVLAAAGPAAPPKAKPEITYQFQMVEVRGLSWRDPGQSMLRSVAHHGAVSVWTAPGDFLDSLPKEARGAITTNSKIHGPAQVPTHLTTRKEQAFVTRVSWKGEGKAPKQITENIREGIAATVIGRKIDQGVLVQLVIDDTDIRSVHTIDVPSPKKVAKVDSPLSATSVEVSASMDPDDSTCTFNEVDVASLPESEACDKSCPMTPAEHKAARSSETSQSGWAPTKAEAVAARAKTDAKAVRAGFKASTTGSQIQLPEIGRASAAGEWLIPEDGVLVIGFGPHTVADADGKAVVREHVAVITAEAEEGTQIQVDALAPPPPIAESSEPAPAPATTTAPRTAAAIPSLPSRTLPQGLNVDGTPSVLPPLPDEAKADEKADDSKSDEPLASPQSKRKVTPSAESPTPLPRLPVPAEAPVPAPTEPKAKKVDHKAAKTSFSFPQLSQFRASSLFPLPLPGAQFLLPLKAFGLKLPFNQKLEFELIGRIVPDPDAATEDQVVAVGN